MKKHRKHIDKQPINRKGEAHGYWDIEIIETVARLTGYYHNGNRIGCWKTYYNFNETNYKLSVKTFFII